MNNQDLVTLRAQLHISKLRAKQLEASLDRLFNMIDEIQERIYDEEEKYFDYYTSAKEA
jgi:hypothetical protein